VPPTCAAARLKTTSEPVPVRQTVSGRPVCVHHPIALAEPDGGRKGRSPPASRSASASPAPVLCAMKQLSAEAGTTANGRSAGAEATSFQPLDSSAVCAAGAIPAALGGLTPFPAASHASSGSTAMASWKRSWTPPCGSLSVVTTTRSSAQVQNASDPSAVSGPEGRSITILPFPGELEASAMTQVFAPSKASVRWRDRQMGLGNAFHPAARYGAASGASAASARTLRW